MPFQALYGVGNPDLSTNNQQIGLYLQDDWRINPRLTANIGLRWDFETDMLNNDYVTPAEVVAGLGTTYPSNYFTDGTQRPIYYGAIQPRIGLSYDITGDGKTVVFGGYGRYFDRTLYNDILDEKYRLQYEIRTFWFSEDGSPQDGRPAIKWDPAYLTKEGLDSLIAQGIAPAPEVYLLNNDTRPPSSDQFSAGIRKSFDLLNVSLSYQGVYSKNQMTWTCGIKAANGSCDWGARPTRTSDSRSSRAARRAGTTRRTSSSRSRSRPARSGAPSSRTPMATRSRPATTSSAGERSIRSTRTSSGATSPSSTSSSPRAPWRCPSTSGSPRS